MVGTLTAVIGITAITSRTAAFTGGSALSLASISQKYVIAAAFTGSGILGGVGPGQQSRNGVLAGGGTLTAACKPIARTSANLTGGGTLTAAGKPGGTRTVNLTSTGQLTATASSGLGVTLVTSAINNNTTSANRHRSVTFSSYTPVLDDVVILFSGTGLVTHAYTVPSGWTGLFSTTTSVAGSPGTYEVTSGIYHRITAADVSSGVTTYTATNYSNVSGLSVTFGVVLRNVSSVNPPLGSIDEMHVTSSTTTHIIAGAGLTPAAAGNPGGLWLSIMGKPNTTAYTAAPTGWTTLQSVANTSGDTGACRLLYRNALITSGESLADITFTAGVYATFSVIISAS